MTALKANEVEGFLAKLEKGGTVPFAAMAYGPDRGLVAESLARFAKATGIAIDDPMCVVVLDGTTLSADPGRLMDELNGPGLFGGGRLVRLREAGNDKRLVSAIAAVLADPPSGAFLAVEGGDLKRGSALLKAFEKARGAVALPCYADDARAVERTIDRIVSEGGTVIDADAKAELARSLGGDRLASRAEIEKLLLYAHGQRTIGIDDVRAVVGDAGAVAADDAVDGALSGDAARLERALGRLLASKASPFLVLRDLTAQLQLIERALEGAAPDRAAGSRAAERIERAGPRVHFKRLPALKRAAASLSPNIVRDLCDACAEAILESRKRSDLEAPLVRRLCLDVVRHVRTGAQSAR